MSGAIPRFGSPKETTPLVQSPPKYGPNPAKLSVEIGRVTALSIVALVVGLVALSAAVGFGIINLNSISDVETGLDLVETPPLLDQVTVTVPVGGSIDDAIAQLTNITAKQCTIVIEGTLDLGDDPIMCFFPIARQCKHIDVVGVRTDVVQGEVTNIAVVGDRYQRYQVACRPVG